MPYKLFTDKNENFTAEVSVKNASLKNSVARIVVESDNNLNLVFNGNIENGTCTIPIKRLKGILDENSRGKMHLEIIVEDVFFKPWESEFVVEEHTSVKAVVQEQKEDTSKPIVEVKVPLREDLDIYRKGHSQMKHQGHVAATPNTGEVEYLPAKTSTSHPPVLDQNFDMPDRNTCYGRVNEKDKKEKIQKGKTFPAYPSDELLGICERLGIKKKDLNKKILKELLVEYFKENKEFASNRAAISRQFLKKIK